MSMNKPEPVKVEEEVEEEEEEVEEETAAATSAASLSKHTLLHAKCSKSASVRTIRSESV